MKELIEREVEKNAADQSQIRRVEKGKQRSIPEVPVRDAAVGPTSETGVGASERVPSLRS